mmetsp:Transcript_27605/g.70342  ORF Transcript_27605/g.70342 Transcript_27605/m.70342 type:complete len:90 (+) Transcript_27605:104-373(+)
MFGMRSFSFPQRHEDAPLNLWRVSVASTVVCDLSMACARHFTVLLGVGVVASAKGVAAFGINLLAGRILYSIALILCADGESMAAHESG